MLAIINKINILKLLMSSTYLRTYLARARWDTRMYSLSSASTSPEDYGYKCSIRPMNQKAEVEVKSPRISYLQPIQYLVVMEFGAKPVITPTNRQKRSAKKACDIINSGLQC